MSDGKNIKTIKEFIANRKKSQSTPIDSTIDWTERRMKWINSVQTLYNLVDDIIVKNLEESGFKVTKQKVKTNLHEDHVGSYEIDNYTIKTDGIELFFFPIGTIILGAYGKVNLILPSATVKLVLKDWETWKIVSGIGSSMKLIDFNEKNIVKLLQDHL